MFAERNKCGLDKFEHDHPFWAIEAFKANERTFAKAEAEWNADQNKSDEDESLSVEKGGDSDAFANIENQFNNVKGD